jgi:hypothetical protein
MTTTNAATPAQRLLTDYLARQQGWAQELTARKAALLFWAGRDGRYNLVDLVAILKDHDVTLSAWSDACSEAARFQSIYDAEALLAWLGY